MTLADFFPPQLKSTVFTNSLAQAQQSDQTTDRHLPRSPLADQHTDVFDLPVVHSPRLDLPHQSDLSRLVILRQDTPEATPWKPGTRNLYPRPDGAPYSTNLPERLPIWHVQIPHMSPQTAMFQVADNIAVNAFYIAADEWTRKPNAEWKVTKIFGAFHDPASFVRAMLKKFKTRCFYEIIRQDRPCNAYGP
jgi:hypothetical protein